MGLKYPFKKIKSIDYYPVGSLYTQYAVAADNDLDVAMPVAGRPATLFGGTWEKLYDDEGTFFCTEGYDYDDASSANKRASGLMPDQGQKLTGRFSTRKAHTDQSLATGSGGVFSLVNRGSSSATIERGGSQSPRDKIFFDSSGSPNARTSHTTAGRTVPRNRLMRVWRRTA